MEITRIQNQLKIDDGTPIYIPFRDLTLQIINNRLEISQKQLVRVVINNPTEVTNIASSSLENLADLISNL